MSRTTPPITLPVRPDKQCQILLPNGTKCETLAWAIATRIDGSTQRLCNNHAKRLRQQLSDNPTIFSQVRISIINK